MNRFKYRLPHTTEVISGGSQRLLKGFADGFVVAPFSNPDEGLLTIPYDICNPSSQSNAEHSYIPDSTSRDDFENEVRIMINALGENRGKAVAARTIRVDCLFDPDATFENLCTAYPDAFVFLFSTSLTGTWIGASPELLLRCEGDFLSTMALAGTRPVSYGDDGWDEKNRDEQAMVAEFIIDILKKNCGAVTVGKTFTKKAGLIEHICTPISAFMAPTQLADEYEGSYSDRLRKLLTELSPTPALCGTDRQLSLELIRTCENFSREMYGGFCGPHNIGGNSAFFVNLRSAKVSSDAVCIYAGCGITPLSNPSDEWNETEMKSKTIINNLKTLRE